MATELNGQLKTLTNHTNIRLTQLHLSFSFPKQFDFLPNSNKVFSSLLPGHPYQCFIAIDATETDT